MQFFTIGIKIDYNSSIESSKFINMGCGNSAFDQRFQKAVAGKLERTLDKLDINQALAKKFFIEFEKM